MTFRTRKEGFLAETAAPEGVAAQSDTPPARPDDDDPLPGYRRMSEFAISQGYPVSTSTLQKRGSPAIGTGPGIIGYFGQLPVSTKGLMRQWLRAGLRSDRPMNRRWERRGAQPALPVTT